MKKYSVLTCLFGKYDNLWEIKDKNPDVEYICVTDNKDLKSDTWDIIVADETILMIPFVNQWTYVRYHPFEFVNTDVCVYVDGSIDIVKDFSWFVDKKFIRTDKEYGVMIHPWRSTITQETYEWYRQRGYSKDIGRKVIDFLYNTGYKVNGLIQSTILMMKNTKDANIINNRTWELCHQWSDSTEVDRNNQCGLTYIINTLYYDSDKIMFMSPQVICSDYMHWRMHNDGSYYGWDGYNSAIAFDKENYGLKIE